MSDPIDHPMSRSRCVCGRQIVPGFSHFCKVMKLADSTLVDPPIDRGPPVIGKPRTPAPVAHDPITAPDHYRVGDYECRDVIAALGLSFNRGAAFKYIWRAGRKAGASELEDIKKAIECLRHEVARMEAKAK